jgi:hypothetical protein
MVNVERLVVEAAERYVDQADMKGLRAASGGLFATVGH